MVNLLHIRNSLFSCAAFNHSLYGIYRKYVNISNLNTSSIGSIHNIDTHTFSKFLEVLLFVPTDISIIQKCSSTIKNHITD